MQNQASPHRIAEPSPRKELLVVLLCGGLILLPELFLSTDPYLAALRFPAVATAAILGWRARLFPSQTLLWKLLLACILAVHGFSAIGGAMSGLPFTRILTDASLGLVSIIGLGAVTGIFLKAKWGSPLLRMLAIGSAVLAVSSLAAYFLPLDRLIPIGNHPVYYEPTRLVLLWPTRLLAEPLGQLAWEHSNHAGFLFSIVLIGALEILARTPRKALLWCLVVLMGTCVFLTGSRSAWLMLIATLPLILFRRRASLFLGTLISVVISILLGLLLLDARTSLLKNPELAPKASAPPIDLHTTGLIERGSSGRLSFYPLIWKELEGHRTFGKGLAATGKPVGYLYHEHSIFLGTFRGGGILSTLVHLALTGMACWLALVLYLKGKRWPLLLLTAVLANCLFDRSNVFKLSGSYEFILYWPAVFIPFLLERKSAPLIES